MAPGISDLSQQLSSQGRRDEGSGEASEGRKDGSKKTKRTHVSVMVEKFAVMIDRWKSSMNSSAMPFSSSGSHSLYSFSPSGPSIKAFKHAAESE